MKSITGFVIIFILIAGCTANKETPPSTIPPTVATSSVVVVDMSTPYIAPTIEKIIHSHYIEQPPLKETTIAVTLAARQSVDPIIGIWDVTNTSSSISVIFSTSNSGSIRYYSESRGFSWKRGGISADKRNITYNIYYSDSDQNNGLFVYYDTVSDKGTTSITTENQFLTRR